MQSDMNYHLVENLIKEGVLKNKKTIEVVRSIDRGDFTPSYLKGSQKYMDQ